MDESYFLESCKGDRSLTERRLPRERGGNRGRRGSGVGPASRLDGGISRRADLYGSPPVDGGDGHRSGNFGRAGRRLRVCHRWTSQLRNGKPEPEHSPGSGSRQPRELRRGSWHLNTVNPRHMTMKRWLNHHYRGVSTRYLDHYMLWLMRSEFKLEESIEADFLSPHLANYTQVDT